MEIRKKTIFYDHHHFPGITNIVLEDYVLQKWFAATKTGSELNIGFDNSPPENGEEILTG